MSLKNKENLRRCFKCGRSPAEDQTITLFRFPKPGKTNTLHCELWARYCFPDQEWFSPEFQHKLHSEHKMLCSKHFPRTSFSDYPLSTKKLHRFAVPDEIKKIEPQPGTSLNLKGNINLSPVAMVDEATRLESTTDKPMLEPVQEPSHVVRVLQDGTKLSFVTAMGKVNPSSLESTIDMPLVEPVKEPLHVVGVLQDRTNLTTVGKANLLLLESTIDMPISEAVQEPSHILQHSTNLSSVAMVSEATNIKKPMIQPVPGSSKSNMAPIKCEKTKKERYLYAKCRKHMKAICQLRKRVTKLKNKAYLHELQSCDSIGVLTKKLTPTFALLLQAQIKNLKKKSKGRRWTTDEKITALRLYKRSPTCYRLMRRLFCLPAQSTLKSLLSYFSLEVGVNDAIFSVLSKTAEIQKPSDNEYVLMFDEMSIKKNMMYNKNKDVIEGFQDHGLQGRCSLVASHALVFMIAGIRKKVKQPIAYYLSSSYVTADRLAVLIKEILHECLRAGISITSTVCDMDGVNRRALAILGATVDKPYITVGNVEVVTMFDPPHLLKCFRNLFMKYDIKCTAEINSNNKSGVGVAKWSHVKDFYELDNKNPNFVFAPALKPEHLNPNSKQKMRVKLAAQVLSHTVAAGMMAKISDGQLTTEAVVTVEVIEKIDKIFDTLNSDSSDLRRGKVYSTNLKNTTPHLKLISDMKSFFKTSEFVGCNRAPPSKDGWIWTLNAVERIWRNLTMKHEDIKSLATRRLQQDPLENMFGCIRGNCGANYNPTAGQFIAALKTAILTKLATQGTSGNCESDVCQSIINNYKTILTKKATNICTTTEPHNFPLPSETEMSEQLESSGEIQACAYVCGFLIKNLDNINSCEKCKNIVISNENLKEHLFVTFKEYNSTKNSLIYCNKDFIEYIEHCATEINKMLASISHELQILKKITENVKNGVNSTFLKPCAEHYEKNVDYFVKSVSFICIKRYCILRNREFTEEASKAALKRKIDILKHK